jgi:hypothetical protein
MGGYGSGRSGGWLTTESGLTLNLSKLLRDGLVGPVSFRAGSIVWTNTSTGEQAGSIGYEANLGQESGRVRLNTRQPDGTESAASPITGSSSTQRLNLSAAGDGGSSAPSDRRTGGETLPAQRRIHFRVAPGLPAHICLPTRTCPLPGFAPRFQAPGQARRGRAASATTSENPSGCACEPSSA